VHHFGDKCGYIRNLRISSADLADRCPGGKGWWWRLNAQKMGKFGRTALLERNDQIRYQLEFSSRGTVSKQCWYRRFGQDSASMDQSELTHDGPREIDVKVPDECEACYAKAPHQNGARPRLRRYLHDSATGQSLMKRFKDSGQIEYTPGLKVHNSLRSVFFYDLASYGPVPAWSFYRLGSELCLGGFSG